jgi:hypothetical protein
MDGCSLEGCRRFVPGTKRKDGRKERKSMEVGDREDHGPKRVQRTTEKKKEQSVSEPKRNSEVSHLRWVDHLYNQKNVFKYGRNTTMYYHTD